MQLTFWGAAQTVTGSMHLLALNGSRFLLDCGLYQGRRQEARERNASLPFPANSIASVLVSHAHIDHTGNLPTLVKDGFTGPIVASPATTDLCKYMLADSAHLQEKDAEFMAKRNHRRRAIGEQDTPEIVAPLYSVEDAEHTLPLFQSAAQRQPRQIAPGLSYFSYDAGHMLGSTAMVLTLEEKGLKRTLAFSGDVGRCHLPITRDPEPLPPCDYLIMESTYGNRFHDPIGAVGDKLAAAVNRTISRGGKLIVPAFAVGRTQDLVYLLHQLIDANTIPEFPIFVDSPLAVNTTAVFRQHAELFDDETKALAARDGDPFALRMLHYIKDVAESNALNDSRMPCMIISASGMCEAGRILHHLRNNISNPKNTILITGFMAENTLGRKLVDKLPEVPIFGELFPVRAEVVKLNELSGHADQRELLEWMEPITHGLKRVFLVHGELEAQTALSAAIQQRYKLPVTIPARGDSITLD
ncbi:MAG: MBL fold metallo-hydrolase [Bryobacteraceae bacterium]